MDVKLKEKTQKWQTLSMHQSRRQVTTGHLHVFQRIHRVLPYISIYIYKDNLQNKILRRTVSLQVLSDLKAFNRAIACTV